MADWKSSQEFLKEYYASPIVNEDTISAKIKRESFCFKRISRRFVRRRQGGRCHFR